MGGFLQIQSTIVFLYLYCDQPKKFSLQPRMLLWTAGIKSSWNGPQKTTRLGIFPAPAVITNHRKGEIDPFPKFFCC